jgi:hypothetical protein
MEQGRISNWQRGAGPACTHRHRQLTSGFLSSSVYSTLHACGGGKRSQCLAPARSPKRRPMRWTAE